MMASGYVMPRPEFDTASASSDSQFTENEDELSFFEACCECDDDILYDLIQNGTTWEQVNERDKSGRVSYPTKPSMEAFMKNPCHGNSYG